MSPDQLFSVLAEPVRREIIAQLALGERSVSDLVEAIRASQPTVSKHLRVLREHDVVQVRASGQRRIYVFKEESLQPVYDWLSHVGVGHAAKASSSTAQSPSGSKDLKESHELSDSPQVSAQISRSVNRAATRAADLLASLPKFGRRKEH